MRDDLRLARSVARNINIYIYSDHKITSYKWWRKKISILYLKCTHMR